MKEPLWIPRNVVLALQEELLARFGGLGGIRDERLLDSALARPQQLFAYGHPTIFDLAAAYVSGIIRNHPFLDGNKRTGFLIGYTFLGVNGYDLVAPEKEVLLQTMGLAAGKINEMEYACWLKDYSKKSICKSRPRNAGGRPC